VGRCPLVLCQKLRPFIVQWILREIGSCLKIGRPFLLTEELGCIQDFLLHLCSMLQASNFSDDSEMTGVPKVALSMFIPLLVWGLPFILCLSDNLFSFSQSQIFHHKFFLILIHLLLSSWRGTLSDILIKFQVLSCFVSLDLQIISFSCVLILF
jgi:hypothetical protein